MCYSLWYNAPTMLPASGNCACILSWYVGGRLVGKYQEELRIQILIISHLLHLNYVTGLVSINLMRNIGFISLIGQSALPKLQRSASST